MQQAVLVERFGPLNLVLHIDAPMGEDRLMEMAPAQESRFWQDVRSLGLTLNISEIGHFSLQR